MQTNLSLAVEFFGSVAINGVPSVMEGSTRLLNTKGGIISAGSPNVNGSAIFGRIMSVLASGTGADDSAFIVGYPSGSGYVIVGPLLNEQGVRENDPAKPNYLFNARQAVVHHVRFVRGGRHRADHGLPRVLQQYHGGNQLPPGRYHGARRLHAAAGGGRQCLHVHEPDRH